MKKHYQVLSTKSIDYIYSILYYNMYYMSNLSIFSQNELFVCKLQKSFDSPQVLGGLCSGIYNLCLFD